LVDLCRSVTQSIVHHCNSPEIEALASMVRPTRSLVVTGICILAPQSEMQSAEKEISFGLFCGQSSFCILQGRGRLTNPWPIAKVAGDWAETCRMLLDVGARLVGNLEQGVLCTGTGRFSRDFCSAASRKGALL
jgi:hypothetical protein